MRTGRVLWFWAAVVAALLLVEVAELTRLFTLPLQSAVGNLLAFIFALVFTTVIALVGALFIGIYISHRLLSPSGFTPFEEEMLRMRAEVLEIRAELQRRGAPSSVPSDPATPGKEERR